MLVVGAGRRPADPRGQRVLRDGRRRAARDAPRAVPGLQPAQPAARPVAAAARDPGGGGDRRRARGSACSAGSRTRIRRGSRSRRSSSTSCGAWWAARARSSNANGLLIDPADGLRVINDVDQLAVFEHASCQTSDGIRRLLAGLEPGMTEAEAVRLLRWNGMPLSCHLMLTAGPRAALGLLSPADRPIGRGEPFTTAFGIWGALTCRAGWVVEDADELPDGVRDYVDRLVAPYFEAVAEWYAALHVGQVGGALQAIIDRRLGDPFFGIGLNPGHQLHLDEWVNSPVWRDSTVELRSGMVDAGRHHPGDRHAVLHDQHRGRHRARRRDAAGRVRGGLPGGLGADPGPARVHGRRPGHRPPPRRAAALEPRRRPAAVPAAPRPRARRWRADDRPRAQDRVRGRSPARPSFAGIKRACYPPPVEEQGIQSRHRSCRRIECRSRGRRSKRSSVRTPSRTATPGRPRSRSRS